MSVRNNVYADQVGDRTTPTGEQDSYGKDKYEHYDGDFGNLPARRSSQTAMSKDNRFKTVEEIHALHRLEY